MSSGSDFEPHVDEGVDDSGSDWTPLGRAPTSDARSKAKAKVPAEKATPKANATVKGRKRRTQPKPEAKSKAKATPKATAKAPAKAKAPPRKRRKPAAKTSTAAGVSWNSKASKWTANITVAGVKHFLGAFSDEARAVVARNAAEVRHGVLHIVTFAERNAIYERTPLCSGDGWTPELVLRDARKIFVERDLTLAGVFPTPFVLTKAQVYQALQAPSPVPDSSDATRTFPMADGRQRARALECIEAPRMKGDVLRVQIDIMVWLYKMGCATTCGKWHSVRVNAKESFNAKKCCRKRSKRDQTVIPSEYAGVSIVKQTSTDVANNEQRATVTLPSPDDPRRYTRRQCANEIAAATEYDEHCRAHDIVRRVNFPDTAAAKKFLLKMQKRSAKAGRGSFCSHSSCKYAALGWETTSVGRSNRKKHLKLHVT